MAAEGKQKNEKQKEIARVGMPDQEARVPQAVLDDLNESADFWSAAIAELENEEFTSVDQAVDRVVDLILARIQIEAESQEEVRELLMATFETDPELQEALQDALKLR